jgi:hypothetical protein
MSLRICRLLPVDIIRNCIRIRRIILKQKPDKFGDSWILECSGKEIYANRGIFGINQDLHLYEGYDGGWNRNDFTKEEQNELADYAISLWQQLKNSS